MKGMGFGFSPARLMGAGLLFSLALPPAAFGAADPFFAIDSRCEREFATKVLPGFKRSMLPQMKSGPRLVAESTLATCRLAEVLTSMKHPRAWKDFCAPLVTEDRGACFRALLGKRRLLFSTEVPVALSVAVGAEMEPPRKDPRLPTHAALQSAILILERFDPFQNPMWSTAEARTPDGRKIFQVEKEASLKAVEDMVRVLDSRIDKIKMEPLPLATPSVPNEKFEEQRQRLHKLRDDWRTRLRG